MDASFKRMMAAENFEATQALLKKSYETQVDKASFESTCTQKYDEFKIQLQRERAWGKKYEDLLASHKYEDSYEACNCPNDAKQCFQEKFRIFGLVTKYLNPGEPSKLKGQPIHTQIKAIIEEGCPGEDAKPELAELLRTFDEERRYRCS